MKDFPEEKDASAEGAADDARDPLLRVTNTCKTSVELESMAQPKAQAFNTGG